VKLSNVSLRLVIVDVLVFRLGAAMLKLDPGGWL
jgi:hypothetical protein